MTEILIGLCNVCGNPKMACCCNKNTIKETKSVQGDEVFEIPEQHLEKELEKGPGLKWSELLYIEQNALGLRHVRTEDDVKKEQEHGFYGDALAMSNASNLQDSGIDSLRFIYESDDKKKILDQFRKAVTEFLRVQYTSFSTLPVVKPNMTIEYLIGQITDSFLIVSSPARIAGTEKRHHHGYDEDRYHGLGKFGTRNFSPDDVVASIEAINISRELEQNFKDLFDSSIKATITNFEDFNELVNKLAETVYGLIVKEIRKKMAD